MRITMKARMEECLLLSYRTPARSVRHLVPAPLELVTRDGWAFWNIVACRTEALRPAATPRCVGVDCNQVAYRLHVKGSSATGESLRGLYFVRTDADRRRVAGFGNLLSDFRLRHSDVEVSRRGAGADEVVTVAVQDRFDEKASADALLRVAPSAEGEIDDLSPFATPDEAERFLKYNPLSLALDLDRRWLKLAEAVRDESKWHERPVRVIEAHWNFLRALGQGDLHLLRATRVAPIDYAWQLGRRLPAARVVESPVPSLRRPVPAPRAAA